MKAILVLAFLLPTLVFAAGRIQNEDVKTLTELVSAGGSMAQLINDSKIYVTANGLNQQLSTAITNGAVGGGGGGGSLQWIEGANAPVPSVDAANNRVYLFASAAGQQLYAQLKVPHQYGGSQIKMYLTFYSPDSSSTVLIQSVSTLIRPGTDTFNSTTNQRTSTNSAISLGIANVPRQVVLDLTDSTGKINGVTVAADNYINVQLTRGSDSAPSDVAVAVFNAEVAFH